MAIAHRVSQRTTSEQCTSYNLNYQRYSVEANLDLNDYIADGALMYDASTQTVTTRAVADLTKLNGLGLLVSVFG